MEVVPTFVITAEESTPPLEPSLFFLARAETNGDPKILGPEACETSTENRRMVREPSVTSSQRGESL